MLASSCVVTGLCTEYLSSTLLIDRVLLYVLLMNEGYSLATKFSIQISRTSSGGTYRV